MSYGRLDRALKQARESGAPISVLHLLCHGAAAGSGFGLVFSGESSPSEAVIIDAARLRQLLAPHAGMVRLVVLSACDSGNSGALGNHLGSVAQELHQARFAQVVASRYPLSIKGSIRLSEAFYRALLGGSADVAQAFLAARQRLVLDPTELDWTALQLYSASDPQEARPILFCPYPGRTPFAPRHTRFFSGREQEAGQIAGHGAAPGDRSDGGAVHAGDRRERAAGLLSAAGAPRDVRLHPHAHPALPAQRLRAARGGAPSGHTGEEARLPLLALRENLDRWVEERRVHQTLLTGSQLGYALQMAAEYPEAVDADGRELLAQSERTRAAEEELKLRGLDTLRLLAARSVFAADYTRITTALLETRSQDVTTIPSWLATAVEILHNQVLCTAEIEHGWGLCDARWSPDGQSVVLAAIDGTAQLWELGSSTLTPIGAAHGSPHPPRELQPGRREAAGAAWRWDRANPRWEQRGAALGAAWTQASRRSGLLEPGRVTSRASSGSPSVRTEIA